MKPILFVLGFGIVSALIIALCFYLGFDVTGNASQRDAMKNSTHVEILTNATSSTPLIELSPTESNANTQDTAKEGIYAVYSFCFIRACTYSIR